jgi:hyperosmotically inducible protein
MKVTVLTLLSTAAIAGIAWSQDPNADNTGKNTRDREDQTQTATDQSNDPSDIKMTADIRKMVVDDGSLSIMAKNVKIITIEGVVTLRGPVETEEKAAVQSHGKQAGANQLEIKKS